MPNEKKPNETLKVTDKRIFTADGELKDEYRETIKKAPTTPSGETKREDRGKTVEQKKATEPPPVADQRFLILLDFVAANLSNALEMARRGTPEGREASSQLIDVLEVIEEKTKGNLAEKEAESLRTLTGEAKLRFVQLTKDIKV